MRRKRTEFWHVLGSGQIICTKGRIYQSPVNWQTADRDCTFFVLNAHSAEQAEQLYTESLQVWLQRRAA